MQKTLEQQVKLNGYSASTLTNYGRCIAKLPLYFGCTPLELEDDQINEYLLELNATQSPGKSYFKHTVYGLRYVFRLMNRDDRAIRLPPHPAQGLPAHPSLRLSGQPGQGPKAGHGLPVNGCTTGTTKGKTHVARGVQRAPGL